MPATTPHAASSEHLEKLKNQKNTFWKRRWVYASCFVSLILLTGYGYLASASFVRTFLIPMAEESMAADMEVEEIAFSPFKGISMKGLNLSSRDGDPLISLESVTIRYSLPSLLGGTIRMEELQVVGTSFTVVEKPDGSSQISQWLETIPSGSDSPLPILELKKISIEEAHLAYRQEQVDGTQKEFEMELDSCRISNFGQDASGTLNLQSVMRFRASGDTKDNEVVPFIATDFSMVGDFSIDKSLLPAALDFSGALKTHAVHAPYADLDGLDGLWTFALEPGGMMDASLVMNRNGVSAGKMQITGPLQLSPAEGRLEISLNDLTKESLMLGSSIIGHPYKADGLNAEYTVDITNAGSAVSIQGLLDLRGFSVANGGLWSPSLDLEVESHCDYSRDAEALQFQKCDFHSHDQGKKWLTGHLLQPTQLLFQTKGVSIPSGIFELEMIDVDLASWHAFTPEMLAGGRMNGHLKLKSENADHGVEAVLEAHAGDVQWMIGGRSTDLGHIDLRFHLLGGASVPIELKEARATWEHPSAGQILTLGGAGEYHSASDASEVQLDGRGNLARLGLIFEHASLDLDSGETSFAFTLNHTNDTSMATLQVRLGELNGRCDPFQFEDYSISLGGEASLQDQALSVRGLDLGFPGNQGGEIKINGNLDLEAMQGMFELSSSSLDAADLKPLLSSLPQIGDLNHLDALIDGRLMIDTSAEHSFKGSIGLKHKENQEGLSDPLQGMHAYLEVDAGWDREQIRMREFSLKLPATQQGDNTLRLEGTLPMEFSMDSAGSLKLNAESLDLTPYTGLWSGDQMDLSSGSQEPEDSSVEPGGDRHINTFPGLGLAIGELDMSFDIDRLQVHDLIIESLQGRVLYQTNMVLATPVKMVLNEGPVSAGFKVDFSNPEPSYTGDLDFEKVPLGAITGDFAAGQTGKLQGLLTSQVSLKGMGFTLPVLQENMEGTASFNYTDAGIHVQRLEKSLFSKMWAPFTGVLKPITGVLRLPGLLKSPIHGVEGKMKIQNQTLELREARILSDTFQVHADGEVQLAPVLTNSVIHLPIDLYLERSLAKNVGFLSAGKSKDTPFVKLPRFVKLEGTLGNYQRKWDNAALAGLGLKAAAGLPLSVGQDAVKAAVGLPKQVGESAVKVLKDVKGLLTGVNEAQKVDQEVDGETEENASGPLLPKLLKEVNPLNILNKALGSGAPKKSPPSQQQE
ncbi:MAG: hypothetical protein P8L18_13265 [Verrucomicrobiota bacterium]|nr:hypothetical protein [Verrucomicrobiota bacterium]